MKRTLILVLVAVATPVWADPCGLVPPISTQDNPERYLTRTGDQLTYVFFKDGIEDVCLRPAFEGKVSEFGMLIPFPTPPAIRKISDDVFYQVKNAVEPPEVKIVVEERPPMPQASGGADRGVKKESASEGGLKYDTVKVINEEAMGMYQVAVLAAGSADALKKWMEKNKYMFPAGMEKVIGEYIEKTWCFVAVKARVGKKKGVRPKPGMRDTDDKLPEDAKFTGAVQAMGFRFKVEEPVVPMRLSAHNPGTLHNIVYALSDKAVRFRQLPRKFVKKQISGEELHKNLTEELPAEITFRKWGKEAKVVRVKRGEQPKIPKGFNENWAKQQIKAKRVPAAHNGFAGRLFASDMLAAKEGRLIHQYEERQKELLNIGEELGLRGPHVDSLLEQATKEQRDRVLGKSIEQLKSMTMTVMEGDFPREVIRDEDLTMVAYHMPKPKRKSLLAEPLVVLIVVMVVIGLLTRRRFLPINRPEK